MSDEELLALLQTPEGFSAWLDVVAEDIAKRFVENLRVGLIKLSCGRETEWPKEEPPR